MKRLRFAATVMLAAAILALDLWTPQGLATWLLQAVVVWMATAWTTRRELIALGSICALFIFLGFAASPEGLPVWIGVTNCLLGSLAIALVVLTHLKRAVGEGVNDRTAAALEESRSEIKVLRGLLPICSSCKKIRNKAGQWEQMEVYISGHSEASFTHDLCPECIDKLYPGLPSRDM
jgi:hypothetical protein